MAPRRSARGTRLNGSAHDAAVKADASSACGTDDRRLRPRPARPGRLALVRADPGHAGAGQRHRSCQMSSQGGRMSFPGVGAYSAAGKFANSRAGRSAGRRKSRRSASDRADRRAEPVPHGVQRAGRPGLRRPERHLCRVLAAVRASDMAAADGGAASATRARAGDILVRHLVHGSDLPLAACPRREAVERISAYLPPWPRRARAVAGCGAVGADFADAVPYGPPDLRRGRAGSPRT